MYITYPVGIDFMDGLGADNTCDTEGSGCAKGFLNGTGQNGIYGDGNGSGFEYPTLNGYGISEYVEYAATDGHGYGYGTPHLLHCYKRRV